MKEWQCVPSCTYNKYVVREIFESNFDSVAYHGQEHDGANFEVNFYVFDELFYGDRLYSSFC